VIANVNGVVVDAGKTIHRRNAVSARNVWAMYGKALYSGCFQHALRETS
jgi:hypothetical protein